MLADFVIGGGNNLEAAFVESVTGLSMNPVPSVSPTMVFDLLSVIWIYLTATILEAAYTVFTDALPKVCSAAPTNSRATPKISSENLYTAVRTG